MKVKVSCLLPAKLKSEMRGAMHQASYGLREKSRWLVEAIKAFLELNNYRDYIMYCCEIKGLDAKESFLIPSELKERIDEEYYIIRKDNPYIEGIKSAILRAAIIQRISRGDTIIKKSAGQTTAN
jgi:hypothetical protein